MALPHTGNYTEASFLIMKWPPRSPDLTLCDLFLWDIEKVKFSQFLPEPSKIYICELKLMWKF